MYVCMYVCIYIMWFWPTLFIPTWGALGHLLEVKIALQPQALRDDLHKEGGAHCV